MQTAGPESSLYKKVDNPNPDTRPEPTDHWPQIEIAFASTREMVDFATSRTPVWQPDEQGSIRDFNCRTQDEIAEYGTATWREAVSLAQNGWPDGQKLLTTARSQYISSEKIQIRIVGYGVGGSFPDVPRFLAGDPEHIRVVVSPNCPISVTAESRANWGAAFLSWVAAEELAGNTVEIDVIYVTKAPCYYLDEYKWGPPVIVKYTLQRTNSYKSIDQLAFWLMHPAAHRRIQFAIKENLHIGKWYKLYRIYGNAVTNREDIRRFLDKDDILLILGTGAESVQSALSSIEVELEKWKERQFHNGNAVLTHSAK
jgi:hypothetical protein